MEKKNLLIKSKAIDSILMVLILVGLLIVVPCKSIAQDVKKKAPIKIGVILDVSSIGAEMGVVLRNATIAAIDYVNSIGGVDGRLIEYYFRDDGTDPVKGAGYVRSLVQKEGVVAVIGSVTSTVTAAMTKVGEELKVPIIGPAISSIPFNASPYGFTPYIMAKEVGYVYTKKAKELGWKSAAIEYNALAWGIESRDYTYPAAKELGLSIVGAEGSERDAIDLSVLCLKLRALNPDGVMCYDYPPQRAIFLKSLKKIEWNPAVLHEGISLWSAGKILGSIELANGHWSFEVFNPNKPEAKRAFDIYKQRYGESLLLGDIPCAFDSVMILAEAVKRAGTDNPKALRDAIEGIKDMPVASGRINSRLSFSPTKHYFIDRDTCEWAYVKNGERVWPSR